MDQVREALRARDRHVQSVARDKVLKASPDILAA
jgi:hypothetical protein